MPLVDLGKQKVYYESAGEGEAIFLLHDLFEDHGHFNHIQEELSKSFHVISLDLPGSGQSPLPKEPFEIEDLAKLVIELADKLKIEKFHVIGDSYGGAIAQVLAYKHADRVEKVVLSNSFLKLPKASEWFLEMIGDHFKEGMSYPKVYELILPWFFSSWFLKFEEDVKKIVEKIEKSKHPLKYKAYQSQLEALKSFDSTKWVKKIERPTLMIIGEEDLFCLFKDSRSLLNKLPHHKAELCSGGHKSKLECPTRYLEVITNFLEKVEEESAETKK